MFITDEIDVSRLTYPAAFDDRTLFFDIETSGTSFSRSHITVIGTAYVEGGAVRVSQWFADLPGSEPAMIADFFESLSRFDTLVTYNGISFDVPYVKRRAAHWGIPLPDAEMKHLDLFKYSKPFAKLFELPNRKLKTIETGLFIERKDRLSGADCVSVYLQYLRTGDPDLCGLILQHNREDIVNLIDAAQLMTYYDILHGGFSVTGNTLNDTELTFECVTDSPVPREVCLRSDRHAVFIEGRMMRVTFFGAYGEKKLYRKDYKNYYYLPSEDMAVHKSVGRFAGRSSRVQATAATCYERQSALFFAQPDVIVTPYFQDDIRDEASYFRENELPDNKDLLRLLCLSVLESFI